MSSDINSKNPYEGITFVETTPEIKDKNGNVIFNKDVSFPDYFREQDIKIVSSKYFKKHETDLRQMINRVSDTIADWGITDGYFQTQGEAEEFRYNLKYYQIHQYFAFNSPVYFNVGIDEKPQASACFILSVEDDMDSITSLAKNEAVIFKKGSGTGTNLSNIRGSNELVGDQGKASGPVSFLKAHDCQASVIKSGGALRRSAKLACLDMDHPDIEKFINCKDKEELKMMILKEAGIQPDEGYDLSDEVFLQSTNISVRINDDFIKAVKSNGEWSTLNRVDGSIAETYKAKELLEKIAKHAWTTGDPGVQFHDNINKMNPVISDGEIVASNPCQPDFATVLTPYGIKQFKDISVGDKIWSGENWTTITRKISTGVKPVYKYSTSQGRFIGTKNHNIFNDGEKIEVDLSEAIDICIGEQVYHNKIDSMDVMNGLLIGDGSIHKANNNLIHLTIGENDCDYFTSEVSHLIGSQYGGNSSLAYKVTTTLPSYHFVHTYDREIPEEYRFGSTDKKLGFLRGLYSANGSVIKTGSTTRITLKQTNYEMIQQVQEMLSSVGIQSYITKNNEKIVIFGNGKTYECKKSYDLNITSDRKVFYYQIGFIQKYKMDALLYGLNVKGTCKKKSCIHSKEYIGDFEVFSITVEDEKHRYWSGGVLTANCSEFMFLNDSSCNLASTNLKKFFIGNKFDYSLYAKVVSTAILAQEIIVDRAYYPIDAIEKNTHKYRPLGLGYSNLGAVIMTQGYAYDSDEARDLASLITAFHQGASYLESKRIANVKGVPKWWTTKNKRSMYNVLNKHYDSLLNVHDAKNLWGDIKASAVQIWQTLLSDDNPVRNAQVSVLAPTGTISFLMGCDTTGIEPEFSLVKYKTLSGSDGAVIKTVNATVRETLINLNYDTIEIDSIINDITSGVAIENCKFIKPNHISIFDTAVSPQGGKRSIHYMGHIKMMAAIQPFISGAISKTCNVPNDATVEDIYNIYLKSWDLGLKSVAIYRDGSKTLQVLSTNEKGNESKSGETQQGFRKKMPTNRTAEIHSFTINHNVSGYLIPGMYDDGNLGEFFVKIAKDGSTLTGLVDALATITSIALQYGVPLKALVEKMMHRRFEPSGFTDNPKIRTCTSLVDYMFKYFAFKFCNDKELEELGLITAVEKPKDSNGLGKAYNISASPCPKCGALMRRLGSCELCGECGWNGGACG